MTNKKLVAELDRNMDTVYDDLYVLNGVVDALVQALQPQAAARVTQLLDGLLDNMHLAENPPSASHQDRLRYWRNRAATSVGVDLMPRL